MGVRIRRVKSEAEGEWSIVSERTELLPEMQERVKIIQQIMAVQGTNRYGQVQKQAASNLGISVRSLRRLVKLWQEQGLEGLLRQSRKDQGVFKIKKEWQEFIERTYREGNRGSRQMSRAQVAVRVKVRGQELGLEDYPSRATVYRILTPSLEKQQQPKRSLGWRSDCLRLKTREGLEIPIEWSNQVWQCDHTPLDVLVVDRAGEILGRPWLTIVVDTYSRCLMGMNLGFDAPSAAVVCLALRHAILPKQYSSAYELEQSWGTYGLPQYLYTDGGKDFRSQHLEQVATELGIVLCLRRKPSDGGIVERPFGTFNREFLSSLPGYTDSNVVKRSASAEAEACLTLQQLEQLLVRYLVDNYNQAIDARMGNQSRSGRWEAGRIAQLPLLGERELDICLMRRERRRVYRSGYIQFANFTYQGEHLAAYAGESVIIRYNPLDITTIFVYQLQESKEVFVTRAHAQGWETETLSYKEAQAISRRRRAGGQAIDNCSRLAEVRARDEKIKKLQRQKRKNAHDGELEVATEGKTGSKAQTTQGSQSEIEIISNPVSQSSQTEKGKEVGKKPVPYVRVYDYEQMKREAGWL